MYKHLTREQRYAIYLGIQKKLIKPFVTFILKNLHSGYNKINWTRTISKSAAILQTYGTGGARQDVTYINPMNKKRQINFDEELLIIYYSILQYKE